MEICMYPIVRAFKAELLCCPRARRVNETKPTLKSDVKCVFLPASDNDGMIQMLKQGLAAYKVATENVPRPGPRPHWVVEATGRPSHVGKAAKIMMAISSSLAAAENVFSSSSAAFSAQHERVLED